MYIRQRHRSKGMIKPLPLLIINEKTILITKKSSYISLPEGMLPVPRTLWAKIPPAPVGEREAQVNLGGNQGLHLPMGNWRPYTHWRGSRLP